MRTVKNISIIIGFILFLNFNLSAFYVFNGAGSSFCTDCEGTTDNNLNQLINIAAGYYLKSCSDFQIVLKKIELNETGVIDYIGKATQNMTAANAKYFEIWETSKSLEYDRAFVEKLSQFDFSEYQLENNLNPIIFQKVEGFLKQGHVRELFQQAFEDSSKILEKIKGIQTNLESGKMVEISDYWRLNQLYLEFSFFGQYASEVFI